MDPAIIPARFMAVTPSDSATLNTPSITKSVIGLYIGTGGTLTAAGMDNVPVQFTVTAGQYLSGRFNMVKATGTTASGIVAAVAP